MRKPNGYGTVAKLSGKRRRPFAVRITAGYTDEGKQIYKYLGYYATRKEAEYQLSLYNANPYDINLKNLTFKDVYKRFYDVKKNTGTSEKRLKAYESFFKKLVPLYNMKMIDIKTPHLQTLFDTFTEFSPLYVREIKSFTGFIYKYAMEIDILDKDYTKFLKLRKFKKQRKNSVFSAEEQQKLWENVETIPGADILLILIYTGFRVNELLSVKKEKIDLENWTVTSGSKTDAGKERVVPIHHRIQPLIIRYMQTEGEYLIPNHNFKSHMNYSSFKRRFSNILKKLKMEHTIHDTRYTFITSLREVTDNNAAITSIVGHTNIQMTDKYTLTNIQKMRQEIDKIN